DPATHVLPRWYFSANWAFLPNAELKPRPEVWGGLALPLAAGTIYAGIFRRDALAWRLALWGMLGGAIGFPLGQCIQSMHAWNPEWFQNGFGHAINGINWWNFMETTFGATWGATLALGLWLHRERMKGLDEPVVTRMPLALEFALVALHVGS